MTVIMSLAGMVVLVGIAFAASNNRKAIQLRTGVGSVRHPVVLRRIRFVKPIWKIPSHNHNIRGTAGD